MGCFREIPEAAFLRLYARAYSGDGASVLYKTAEEAVIKSVVAAGF